MKELFSLVHHNLFLYNLPICINVLNISMGI